MPDKYVDILFLDILLTRLPLLLVENEAALTTLGLVCRDCKTAISYKCDEEWKQIVFRKWAAEPLCLRQNKNENWYQVFLRNMHRDIKAAFRAKKTHEFWDKQFADNETEWLAPYDDFRSLFLEQLGSNLDCKILIVGCGTSHVAERLWHDGYKNVTSTDISDVAIEHMKHKTAASCPDLKWQVADVTQLSSAVGIEAFDIVFDKGVADTILFRNAKRRGAKFLLNDMYRQIHTVLRPNGRYIVVSPRMKLPYLKSEHALRTGISPPFRALPNAPAWRSVVRRGPLTPSSAVQVVLYDEDNVVPQSDQVDASKASLVKKDRAIYFFTCSKS